MTIDPKNLAATATLTFDDEFNTFSMWNGTSGTWQTSYPWSPASGGTNAPNHELEWYINPAYAPTSSVNPFSDTNGVLTIEAKPASATIQSITGLPYTSGIITTDHSFSQTYGYFEMRAQLPTGQGIWPAFWLLPVDQSWPPEIDVMEVIGSSPNELNTTVHYGNNQATGFVVNEPGMTTGFHTYGVDWEPDYITWYFDGNAVSKTPTPAGMNKPMYMLANLAVGGDWPGAPNSTTPFPADMKIDYIRAYSSVPGGGTTPPPVTPPPVTPPPVTPPPPSTTQHLFDLPTTAATTHLITGTSGNDVLTATSTHTYFDSWGGNDTMTGLGNDVFEIYSSKNIIKEAAGSGINTVNSGSTSFVLPDNVQNITLIGNGGNHNNGSQSATGNGLDNLMISNSTSYGNTLIGNVGNDELIAGKGADVLTGGTGADEFVFKALPTKAGHVTDFTAGTDMLDLRGIFKTAGYTSNDPIADSHLILTANANGGTAVYYDASGNPTGTKVLITTLDHVLPSALHLQSDIWFV